jgi:hypothetical protein
VAASARALRAAPRRSGDRPDLRVVGRPERRRSTGARLVAGLVALFLALFTNAVAHSVLVSGQERLDHLTTEVEQAQLRNQKLQLRAAELEAPNRIVEAAKDAGLVPAPRTEWIGQGDDPGSISSTTDDGGVATGSDDVDELATGAGDGTSTGADDGASAGR